MNSAVLTSSAFDALTLTLILSTPAVLASTMSGLIVGVLQAVTQVHDQTPSFAVKLVCVSFVLLATADWFEQLGSYTMQMFDRIGAM
ncbi:flagellar biosynthetic protein FliQ (plasmid) [Bradyrhizobium sp. 62B]|uniref:EscS/YscS/HrcS family type III secretion system export apparatus protein n=1 Tax=Bradyrhizobium sp. 62B TaxID=2898442 RepID=UPI002557E426|nr:flagellar biosynthetic protein FliQ [Bradyrhizobium sp. 62B]